MPSMHRALYDRGSIHGFQCMYTAVDLSCSEPNVLAPDPNLNIGAGRNLLHLTTAAWAISKVQRNLVLLCL